MSTDRLAGFKEDALRESARQLHSKPLECGKDHLTLLHLSDLHFNNEGSFRFKKAPGTSDAPSLADEVAQALSSVPGLHPPDAVVISGDFALKNTHYELDTYVKKELDALRQLLGVPFSRWIVVPGNHDIDWGAEKYAKASGDRSAVYPEKTKDYFAYVYRRIQAEKECALADRLKKWEADSDDEWTTDPIRHYMPSYAAFQLKSGQRIEIHGYNSCLVEGADWPGIGFVGNGQAALFEYLSAMEAPGPAIKIAVLHHHVKEVSRIVTLPGDDVAARMEFSLIADSRGLLDKLLAGGYSMLLHGHQHQPFISQEVRPCYGTDPADDSWYRDYVDERILIFGAGSVSFLAQKASDRTDNAFFVHRIGPDQTVTTWNFTMGAGFDRFQRRNPCVQPLRGYLSSQSIKNRLTAALARIEKVDPAVGAVSLPEPCEAVDRVLGTALHELLAGIGALRCDGQKYLLNLPDKAPANDKNVGRSNNLPGRFAKLVRLALEHNVSLFSDDWMPVRLLSVGTVFNLLRWMSLNLAQGILESGNVNPADYFRAETFERAVLSEYDHAMPMPQDAVEQRSILSCALLRRGASGIELLLQHHPEWEAMLVPAVEIRDQDWTGDGAKSKKVVGDNLLNDWLDGKLAFKVWNSGEVVQKLQISPSKGVWTHYTFKLCFLSFDAGAQKKIDKLASPGNIKGLEFVAINHIRDEWKRPAGEIDKELDKPLMRSAVVNRKLIERILDLAEKPDFKYFYDFYDPA